MVVNNNIEKLKDIGLTEYEARAYLTLLSTHPATAYELAKGAGLPTSKIYQVIDKLASRGMVQSLIDGQKKRYVPLKPREFIQSQRRRVQSTLDSLEEDLSRIQGETAVSYMWNIQEYRFFMEKAAQLIAEAEREILISAWDTEILNLTGPLNRAGDSGISVAAVIFGKAELGAGVMFHHPIEDTIYHEKGGRGITLVVDSMEAITGTIFDDRRVEGAWSTGRGFVLMAEDYIKHDIYIMKIVSRFDDILIRRFGDNYRLLRDIFSDKEASDERS